MKKITLAALLLCAVAQAQSGAPSAPLDGNWKIVGWTLPDAVPVRAHLPYLSIAGRTVTGFGGCNRLKGQVGVSGNRLTFGSLGSNRMSCGSALDAQESALLKFLSSQTVTFDLKGDSLTFNGANLSGQGSPMLNIRRMTLPPK